MLKPSSLADDLLANQAKLHPMSKPCDFSNLLSLGLEMPHAMEKSSGAPFRNRVHISIRRPGFRLTQQEERL